MKGAIRKAESIVASTPDAFMLQQFENPDNIHIHYTTTGPGVGFETVCEEDTPGRKGGKEGADRREAASQSMGRIAQSLSGGRCAHHCARALQEAGSPMQHDGA